MADGNGPTVVLTEKRLAQLRREHAWWCFGALVVGFGAGYAVAKLTSSSASSKALVRA